MKNLIKELQWRGLIQDIMPGTEEQLIKEMTSGYIGFDPTADSLHIGNLVPIMLLAHLQRCGHKPFALVGGATGMVGDPSGKSEERNLLNETTLNHNLQCIKTQLEKFLDFNVQSANCAVMVNNNDWFQGISFLDFIRDVGKHITINYMLAKDSVKKRVNSETGMSFTEFSYQLVQGYDFYWLYQHYNCKLQMGGSDQWGNIVTGTELIRRKSGGEAFAFTCPLMTKSDGGKFGKTEKGNVWLDKLKTSPYQFYQFWLNAADEDALKWIKVFTFLDEATIAGIAKQHLIDPGKRVLQKTLANEVTLFVHNQEELDKAFQTSEKLFSSVEIPIEAFTEQELSSIEGIIKIIFPSNIIGNGIDMVSFLHETKIFSSKGEARKMIMNNGISINRKKIDDPLFSINNDLLLFARYLLVQKGKKNYYLIELSDS